MRKTLIFDYSQKGKEAFRLPKDRLPEDYLSDLTGLLRSQPPDLPEVSEIEVVRHYNALSKQNYCIDDGYYPLGSCTMKYNPRLNQEIAGYEGFAEIHPLQSTEQVQGILEILWHLERYLCQIFGFSAFSLQPSAGAQGEYAALMVMKAYHQDHGQSHKNIILIPDSAHGTNPASVTGVGWTCVTIKSQEDGAIDLEDLEKKLSPNVAGMMMTNPNTLGGFDSGIREVAKRVHDVGGLVYWDGANANAIMGYMKPAEHGFDLCHLNLHKTFSTPHGGGGPGAGPIGVTEKLMPYLPVPRIKKTDSGYSFDHDQPKSIGKLHSFYGNAGVLLRAYCYIRTLGFPGLKEVSEHTVLLANYMKTRLAEYYDVVTPGFCKHEFVISLKRERKAYGVRALDVAKRLMDYGFYPPTIYFPLIVSESMMIEVPETEPLLEVDAFIDAMIKIHHEIKSEPKMVCTAPHTTKLKRLDEAKAVKEPKLIAG